MADLTLPLMREAFIRLKPSGKDPAKEEAYRALTRRMAADMFLEKWGTSEPPAACRVMWDVDRQTLAFLGIPQEDLYDNG